MKKIFAVCFFMAAWLFYILVIWALSAQSADESSSLSHMIAEGFAKFICSFRPDQTLADVMSLAGYFEHPVRKLAHFTEYGILGMLFSAVYISVIGKVRSICEGKSAGLYLKNILVVLFLAAVDEIHQFFVPGRYSSFWDVMLDTAGCSFFLFFMYLIFDRKKTHE